MGTRYIPGPSEFGGGRGWDCLLGFGRQFDPFWNGADYAHHITTPLPKFQTFLRPCIKVTNLGSDTFGNPNFRKILQNQLFAQSFA